MRGADFAEAQLEGTDFSSADLGLVTNFTSEQANATIIDKKTKLPDHLLVDWIDDTTFKFRETGQSPAGEAPERDRS